MEQSAESLWERPRRGRRGPAPEHSREQIASTAMELADADGLAAVTMRAVAAALGTGPASLYRYVRTRDELVELMVDAANGEFDYEGLPGGDWLADLLALARQSRAVFLRHPWLLDLADTLRPIGPGAADYLEHALAALAGTGADARTKLEAVGVLNALVVMLTRVELAAANHETAPDASFLTKVAAEGRHPHLAAALTGASATEENPTATFDRVVSRVLKGLIETRS